jgi:hypothetical protein
MNIKESSIMLKEEEKSARIRSVLSVSMLIFVQYETKKKVIKWQTKII